MSNQESKTDEVKNKVTISPDDCDHVKKYCEHFGVPNTPALDAALDKFKSEPSYKNQLNVKLEICKWMLSCEHESFTDNLWDAPKKAAEEVVFDLQFEKDLEEVLVNKDEKNNE